MEQQGIHCYGRSVNAPLKWSDILHDGGFTTTQVAALLDVKSSDVASWLRGAVPLIAQDYADLNGRHVMSFAGLVEARAVHYFLTNGVKRPILRAAMQRMRDAGERHPLARDKKFVTDGFRPFEDQGNVLVGLANDVYASKELLKPALAGRVVFEHGKAQTFYPDAETPLVRIDPRHAVGRPVVVDSGRVVATSALAATAIDEGVSEAADWFGVSEEAARQAVAFEEAHPTT